MLAPKVVVRFDGHDTWRRDRPTTTGLASWVRAADEGEVLDTLRGCLGRQRLPLTKDSDGRHRLPTVELIARGNFTGGCELFRIRARAYNTARLQGGILHVSSALDINTIIPREMRGCGMRVWVCRRAEVA